MKWTDDRVQEWADLQQLLNEIQSINSASHVLERLERCIALAKKLDSTDRAMRRESFASFLRNLWVEEREAK